MHTRMQGSSEQQIFQFAGSGWTAQASLFGVECESGDLSL